MFLDGRKGSLEVLMHQIAQLLWRHLFRQSRVASNVGKETSAVNHLATVFDIDHVLSKLVHDLVRYVVSKRLANLLALLVGFHVVPQDCTDESKRALHQ